MPDRIIHNWNFEPVVQIGERALLLVREGYILCEVIWLEPIPYLSVTTDAISAGGTLEREMKEIYVEDNEFAQWRMRIATSGIYMTDHSAPRATPYWITKHSKGKLPPASDYEAITTLERLQLVEFYQYKDTSRYMTFYNSTASATTATIEFFGYVFQFNEIDRYASLKEVPKPFTPIPCIARGIKGGGT